MSSRLSDFASSPAGAPPLDQTHRDGRLDTLLGEDKLALRQFSGTEGISRPFEYHVRALSRDANINFDPLLGQNVCVTLKTLTNRKRYFNGVVTQAQWTGLEGRYYAYSLVLRPWTWLLGRQTHSRIFKQKTVTDIIKEVFKEAGFNDFVDKVNASEMKMLEYCVQYHETDIDFVSRLMEEWGIYYFFEHSDTKHDLILVNQKSSHVKISPNDDDPTLVALNAIVRENKADNRSFRPGTVPYIPRDVRSGSDFQHIREWIPARQFRSGTITLNDFDYMKPKADLMTRAQTVEKYRPKLDVYHHPGRYTETGIGAAMAKLRLEAEQASDRLVYCNGTAVSLYPGCLFDLSANHNEDGRYLVIQAAHSFEQQSYETGSDGSETVQDCQFVVMKNDRQYRAPLTTPRPVISGSQTAMVTDEDDLKSKWIDVDKEGRILVQFHWNLQKGPDKKLMSRRVRVAQMWSGKDWGWQVIPRVGQEVVVTFIDGDPDQPLVTGTVYNAEYKYPYPLPDNMTISGVKTECEEGQPGYNELIFEDKKNEENIRIHAQRFHEITVREKETRTIGVAQKPSEVARQTTIEKGHDNLVLKHGDQVTLLKMGDQSTKLEMGDQNTKLDVGDQNTHVAKNINMKADMGITIECGQSKITMTPMSIKIESLMIQIDGKAMTEVKGAAMLTVKGGIVMIN